MGQPNEKEDPIFLLDKLNLYQENYTIDSNKSFITLRNIINEYLNYKNILDNNNRKKISKSPGRKRSDEKMRKNSNEIYDKTKIDEINHKFERINKWIKMAKTPYYNNFHLIFQKIRGKSKDKKFLNKELSNINSTKNIFENTKHNNLIDNNRIRKRTDANNIPRVNNDNSEDIVIVKKKVKKNKSFDNSSIINNQDENDTNNNKFNILDNYTDSIIEEKIILFYSNNKSKFIERVFKGPPESFRWKSWCIINEIPLKRDINLYNNYMTINLEKENKDRIIRDIERTFSDTNVNKVELRKMETSLYNILKAYWNLDRDVGYCQGMNLIVGFLLLVSNGNELDSFFLLISNFSSTYKERKKFNYSFRGLFSEEFPLLYFLNFIFDILLEEYIPEVKKHLDEMGITYDLWIGQWFQTLFTIILPVNWCKRLWDCIYSENIFFMVKFGIAFIRILKDDIMIKSEEIDIIDFFKGLQKYSLCPENNYLEQKIDINTLIIKASKIKLDPEDYIKLYKKKEEEAFENFKKKMEKNQKISYILEYGNYILVDDKVKHRETVLFVDEKETKNIEIKEKEKEKLEEVQDNENIKDSVYSKTSNKLEIKEKISNETDNFTPKDNKIKIHINKSILKNDCGEKNSEKKLDTLQNIITSDKKLEKNEKLKINNMEITPEKRKNYFLNNKKNSGENNNNKQITNKNNCQNNYPKTENLNKAQNILINNNNNNYPTKKNINQNNLYANYFGNYYQNQYNQATYSPKREQNNKNYNSNTLNRKNLLFSNNNKLYSPVHKNVNDIKYIDINNYYNNEITANQFINNYNNNINNITNNDMNNFNNFNNNMNNTNTIKNFINLNNNINNTNNINNNKIVYNINNNMGNTNNNINNKINYYNNNINNNMNINIKKQYITEGFMNNGNININNQNYKYNNQNILNNNINTKHFNNNMNKFNNNNPLKKIINFPINQNNITIKNNINNNAICNQFNNLNYNYNNNNMNNNQFKANERNVCYTDNNFYQNPGNCKIIKIVKMPKSDKALGNDVNIPQINNNL